MHVLIALTGLMQATYGLIVPSHNKIRMTYLLTLATLVSGGYLVWHLHTPILQSCVSGLVYLGVTLVATLAAKYRLAQASSL